MADAFNELAELIRSRRTSMLVDQERPVEPELVAELCELAQWAPNHKRTWPWRFAVYLGDGRASLGNVIADVLDAQGEEPAKVDKARTKYLRTPAVLVVGTEPGDTELRTAENRDAVAAGIQNLLLGATALGLASYWGSCPKGANDAVAMLSDFPVGTHVTAIVYLGWRTGAVQAPLRPAVRLSVISA
ncbi:MAG: nitroreductase family protein [Ilumatobacteraceae bacterium]